MIKEPEFDLVVFIGRFSPVHLGHQHVLRMARTKGKHVLVLVGSSGEPRTTRNPFTFEERLQMLKFKTMQGDKEKRYTYEPIYNYTYNDPKWEMQVQTIVNKTVHSILPIDTPDDYQPKIAIIGHSKDETSYYLKSFPQWTHIEINLVGTMHSTDVREEYFKRGVIADHLPTQTQHFLEQFKHTSEYEYIKSEFMFEERHADMWKAAPYPPTFNTTDAIVIQSGHILLIRRKNAPGRGLWALPGGYLGLKETMENSMIRELREETGIKVPDKILRACIKLRKSFDDPKRSSRGRIITEAFLIELNDVGSLPRVKGQDDADKARWVPLTDFINMRDQMFEDHYHIVNKMLGL